MTKDMKKSPAERMSRIRRQIQKNSTLALDVGPVGLRIPLSNNDFQTLQGAFCQWEQWSQFGQMV